MQHPKLRQQWDRPGPSGWPEPAQAGIWMPGAGGLMCLQSETFFTSLAPSGWTACALVHEILVQ